MFHKYLHVHSTCIVILNTRWQVKISMYYKHYIDYDEDNGEKSDERFSS